MVIEHDNIIYMRDIPELGGTSTYVIEMVKKYKDLDIAVVCYACDEKQEQKIRRYCKLYRIKKQDTIKCKVMIINYDSSICKQVEEGKIYMVFHADYSHESYNKYPVFDKRIDGYISITQYIQKKMKEKFGIDSVVCYNPLELEKKKRLILVSATRLSKIKGKDRMIALGEALERRGIDYIWYVFTNDINEIPNPNIIYMKPRVDVYKWIQEADYVVQLSDTEALSYTINEALYSNVPVIVTPLPYLNEIGVKDNENALIMEFDCSNADDVAKRIKTKLNFNFVHLEDNYKNILADGESHYEEENMIRVICTKKFKDIVVGKIRKIGDEWAVDDERADYLVGRGLARKVEEPKPEKVERAVKEEKKEKAVKKIAKK